MCCAFDCMRLIRFVGLLTDNVVPNESECYVCTTGLWRKCCLAFIALMPFSAQRPSNAMASVGPVLRICFDVAVVIIGLI